MTEEYSIRRSTSSDRASILRVVRSAFAKENHDAGEECDIVLAIWDQNAVGEGFDLVATIEGDVVGHLLGSWGELAGRPVIGLAPLSVAPRFQGEGIGSALVRAALRQGDEVGLPLLVLLGSPDYYGRFGFEPCGRYDIFYRPAGLENPDFQVCRLAGYEPSYQGEYTYAWEPRPVPGSSRAVDETPRLSIREMTLDDVGIRIAYFHDAPDVHLQRLGVDRNLLPNRDEWMTFYEEDDRRPIEARQNYSLVWELDGDVVGFSTTDRIDFGREAFMHLHVIDPNLRRRGLGSAFVVRSVRRYFETLQLERLYCEPNAFNVAPNRVLQRAGFRYLFSHECQPSPINSFQVTTRWVIERDDLDHLGDAEPSSW